MMYLANHMIRHNGKLYKKGDEVPLKYEEAQELLKHRAVAQVGKAAADKVTKEAEEKAVAEAAADKATKEANKK